MDQAMQMSCFAWIMVGVIAGWLANRVMHSRQGLVGDFIVGIMGALIGGLLFNGLGAASVNGFSLWTILVAFLGAVILLGVMRLLGGNGLTYRV
jgi:uncharacterized membrane protein YeaQ/YmgE (transglycosylase-associated protein family)